ncbi:MAG: tetratricopeptide repeat protein [Deltaproteobacteria bacterium]|nr:tetratricopeptide repeat protein [Deltaproteobacteria bacterium]
MSDGQFEGISGRFALQGDLGRGAASRVVRVHDRLQNVVRALKLATKDGQVQRYRIEFRRLRELRHPNVVRAFDYGVNAKGRPYYTMELVPGDKLASFADRHDPEALGAVAMQVLDALAAIHARGFVHRDIQPSNILVVGRGTASAARLIDFGLLVAHGDKLPAAGTLPYMAPEVVRGDPVDGRADLYSLGMVLYEALLPQTAVRTVEEAARRLTEALPTPQSLNPVISAGLSDFVMRLVHPDPAARFADAQLAADALGGLQDLRLGRGPVRATTERLLRGGATSHRRKAVAQIKQIGRQVLRERRGRALLVEGEKGVGKSPFLRELASVLALEGFAVGRFRATAESAAPIPTLVTAAQTLCPELFAPEAPKATLPEHGTGAAEMARYAGQIGLKLAQAFGATPTALLIDDLHRAEAMALEVLRALFDELADKPLLVICGADARADGNATLEVLGAHVQRVALPPLKQAEIAALAAHRLFGLQLPMPALLRLTEDSQGMPSLVERTLARLVVDKTIQRAAHGYVFTGGRYRAARHADTELIAARIDALPEADRGVLEAAAVLGHHLSAQNVSPMVDADLGRTAAILAELARREILTLEAAATEPVYAFASRALVTAVYQRIPQARRRLLHDRAAAVADLPVAGRAEEQVEHLLKGSDDSRAVDAAVEAGDRAAVVFADRRAIEYYARAFARLPETGDRRTATIGLRLGRLFERTGELERAAVWFQTAAGAAGADQTQIVVEATLGLGRVAWMRGVPAETEACAARALTLLASPPDRRLQAGARRLQARVAMQAGDNARGEELLKSALADLEAAGADSEALAVLIDLAQMAKKRSEVVQGVRYARLAQRRARAQGDLPALAEATTVLGRGFLQAGRFRAAKSALVYGLRVARANGDRLRQGLVLREIGNVKLREGDLTGALERYERSLELMRATRAKDDEGACLHNIGIVRRHLGDFRASIMALSAALEMSQLSDDVPGTAATEVELGQTYAKLGDLEAARRLLVSALETARVIGDPVTRAEAPAIHSWVEVRCGRGQPGDDLLSCFKAVMEPLEDPADRALVLLYATRCALVSRHTDAAAELVGRLAVEVEDGTLGYLEPFVLSLRGQTAAACGRRDEAEALLQQAAAAAVKSQLRPLDVETAGALGRLKAGTDAGAAHLTHAMETMREIVTRLTPEMAITYVSTEDARQLRAAFETEQQRLGLGIVPAGEH